MVFDKSSTVGSSLPLRFLIADVADRAESEDSPMADQAYSIVVRNGAVVLPQGVVRLDVGIRDEAIVAIGEKLGPGIEEIDATDRIVAPGGVDPHAHIEQVSAGGLLNADTFESATTSAVFGGTTTVISFAAQHVGQALDRVVADYHYLADRGAVIDYAFHMILADPNEATLRTHLPKLVQEGHASIKVFMTYDRIKLDDEQMLDVLVAARDNGAFVCVHAENHGMISFMSKRLLANGLTEPSAFWMSHPRLAEVDAIQRLVAMSRLVDQPIMVFHVSTAEGAEVVRKARADGVKIFAETCPHYLLLTADDVNKPGLEGAKWMCSPSLRTESDQTALWEALARGDLQVISSDHAPYRFDESGKLSAGPNPTFKQIANGLPGLEVRLPLLFDAAVTQGRLGLERFVELTSTAPAKLYGLYPKKGALIVGADADIVLWDPAKTVRISASMMHDRTSYTPYEGRVLKGWPETVLSRGRIAVRDGELHVGAGSGRFLPRVAGEAAKPLGRPSAEFVESSGKPELARHASVA
jgi:dihydropyrimidinase